MQSFAQKGDQMRALVVALVLSLCVPASARAAACEEFTTPGGMHAELCDPGADTAFVLVPGATYTSVYWDFPYRPETYSFQREMVRSGFAAVTVDRLGTGESAKPLSATLTAVRQAAAVNEVVQTLRDKGFEKVVLAGHSLGTIISIISAATFHTVDGVVLTGALHVVDPLAVPSVLATKMEPRALLPDPGYLTTKPGERYSAFHAPAQVEQGVVDTDEATKDVFAVTEAVDGIGLGVALPYSALIDVPVLVAMGEKDPLFCGPLARDCSTAEAIVAQEKLYYAGAPSLSAYVVPGAGHDINLHPDAKRYQRAVVDWVTAHV